MNMNEIKGLLTMGEQNIPNNGTLCVQIIILYRNAPGPGFYQTVENTLLDANSQVHFAIRRQSGLTA